MPFPFILGGPILGKIALAVAAAVTTTYAGKKLYDAVTDDDESAESKADRAYELVETQRGETISVLKDYGRSKLRAYNGVIPEFMDTYRRLKNVKIPESDGLNPNHLLAEFSGDIHNLNDAGIQIANDNEMLNYGCGTLVHSIKSAMTILDKMDEEALNNARSDLTQAITFKSKAEHKAKRLEDIQKEAASTYENFSTGSEKLRQSVDDLKKVIENEGEDFTSYSESSKKTVLRSVKLAQLLKDMLYAPILNQDGNLDVSRNQNVKNKLAAL